MSSVGLDKKICFRVRSVDLEAAEEYIKAHNGLYDDISHFARAALFMALRKKAGYVPVPVEEIRSGL